MNEVLKNWIEIKLEKICSRITKGGTPTTYGYAFQKEGINFIKVENLNKGTVDLRSISDFISQEAHDFQKKSQLQEGDLLFSIAGTIGETCIVKKEILPANTNQALAIIQGFHKVLTPNFLKFQLDSFVARKVTSKARGGAMNNVSLGDLKNLDVLIPPVPEQRAIVAKIEQLFSELDNGIANLKAAKDKLEIYRQAVLKKAFEGELTKEWRIKQKKEIKLEFIGFGDLCKFTQGIQVPIPNQSEVQKKGQVRFLRIIDFTQGNEPPRFIDNPGERYLVNSSDIALVRYGTVGFVCTGKEGAIANNLFKVAPDERLINPYLIHFLNSHLFKSHLKPKGATMQALSFGLIKPIPIPVFEIDEQKQIVQEIESRLSVCDNILANIEEGLEKSEALRQSILKQAFEGKLLSGEELEACRQEPDWEPAEKLLERVKNQKEVTA